MSECANLTYYQRNRDVILNRTKDYYETIKRDKGGKQDINRETYLYKKKIKRENMEKTDTEICLQKKKTKIKRISKKLSRG